MAYVRGVHETGGLQGLPGARSKARREKLTAKLTRLGYQRALLERQLAVWTEKQEVTKHRLAIIEKQAVKIERMIRLCEGSLGSACGHKRRAAAKPRQSPGEAAPTERHSDMSIEY